jgi:hypothetical protein
LNVSEGHKTDIAGSGDAPLRVNWEPTKATAGEHCNGGIIDGMVAGIGPRWLDVERAMGIEYIAGVTLNVMDHRVAGDQERYM